MPFVDIVSSIGPAKISYTISTPECENAEAIDPTLPTVILLHPVYVGQYLFHYQFSDPNLRRFNLIGFEARAHGKSLGVVPEHFRQEHAAEDVALFMDALNLPPCHIAGLSMGACVALQLAVAYPEKALSLFLMSPIPLVEPEEVAAGRQEIFDCWQEALKDPNNVDEDALFDAVFGAIQLAFNGTQSSMTKALVQHIFAERNFRTAVTELHTLSVKMFIDRPPHSVAALQNVKAPINLVHCSGDIAYPRHFVDELEALLLKAGLDVRTSVAEGAAHFGSFTHPAKMNALLYDWVVSHHKGTIPPARAVVSPFKEALLGYGYTPDSDSASSDEDDSGELFVVN